MLRACCDARCRITTVERTTSPRWRRGPGSGLSSRCHTPVGSLPVSPGLRRCRPVLLMRSLGFSARALWRPRLLGRLGSGDMQPQRPLRLNRWCLCWKRQERGGVLVPHHHLRTTRPGKKQEIFGKRLLWRGAWPEAKGPSCEATTAPELSLRSYGLEPQVMRPCSPRLDTIMTVGGGDHTQTTPSRAPLDGVPSCPTHARRELSRRPRLLGLSG